MSNFPTFSEASEMYRTQLLHQASIGCVIETTTEPDLFGLWAAHAKIDYSVTSIYPVYRKVRKYATTWRKPRWHHFYDLIEVVSHFEREKVYGPIITRRRNQRIEMAMECRGFRRSTVTQSHEPIIWDTPPTASFKSPRITTYEFPTIRQTWQINEQFLNQFSRDTDLRKCVKDQFKAECRAHIQEKTIIK